MEQAWFYLATLQMLAIYPIAIGQFDCTAVGMFRYPESTCRSFYICAMYNGNFVKSNYTCPMNKVFDQATQQCSSTASCDWTDIDETCNNVTETSPPWPTFPDPNAVNCESYITCYQDTPVVSTCPNGYFYNTEPSPGGCSTEAGCS